MPDKKRPNDLVNFGALPDKAPPKGTTAPKRSLTREEAEAMMKKAGQKTNDKKKFNVGGATGLPQAAAMSGRTMPQTPQRPMRMGPNAGAAPAPMSRRPLPAQSAASGSQAMNALRQMRQRSGGASPRPGQPVATDDGTPMQAPSAGLGPSQPMRDAAMASADPMDRMNLGLSSTPQNTGALSFQPSQQFKKGGAVRGCGIATKGFTKGRMV